MDDHLNVYFGTNSVFVCMHVCVFVFVEKSPCVASVSPEQPAVSHSPFAAQQNQRDAGPDGCLCASAPAQQHHRTATSMC